MSLPCHAPVSNGQVGQHVKANTQSQIGQAGPITMIMSLPHTMLNTRATVRDAPDARSSSPDVVLVRISDMGQTLEMA